MTTTYYYQHHTTPSGLIPEHDASPDEKNRSGKRRCPLFHSLAARVTVSAAIMTTIAAILIMVGLDYFLSRDFEAIQTAQVRDRLQRVDNYVKGEIDDLATFAHAATRDTALRNNVVAYLTGQNSKQWLQSFVTNKTSLFKLNSVTLWTADGGLVVATENIIGNMALQLGNYPIDTPRYPQAGLVELSGRLWAVSTAPIIVNREIVAIVQFSRLLNERISRDVLLDVKINISTPEGRNTAATLAGNLNISTVDGRPLLLTIEEYDAVELSGLTSKFYVAGIIAVVSAVLVLIFLLLIRRESRPFRLLQEAFDAVGHGDFNRKITIRGCSEAMALCDSFNRMVSDLSRLQEAEAAVQRDIRLAAIGRLAARVAHDINNPLSVIRAIADLSRRQLKGKNETIANDMQRIYEQSNRCLQIAENLVSYTRPKNLTLELLDLHEECLHYLQERKRQSPQFRYELLCECADCTITGNRNYLWQILDNLTDNAVEANGGEIVQYRIFTDGQHGILEITDNGQGFAVDSENNVFEMFYTTKPDGTGLGLPNALAIARAFGGTIKITNPAAGQISVFLNLTESGAAHTTCAASENSPYTIETELLTVAQHDA